MRWVASLPSDCSNLPSTPQWPLLVYALPATCWVFPRLHCISHCIASLQLEKRQQLCTIWSFWANTTCNSLEKIACLSWVEGDGTDLGAYPFKDMGSSNIGLLQIPAVKKRHSFRAMKCIYQETKQHINPWNMWSSEFLKDIWPAQKTFSHPNLQGSRKMTVNMLRKTAEWIEPILLPSALVGQKTAIKKSQRGKCWR